MKETVRKIEEEKIVVIVRGVPVEQLIPMGEAMYEGGIRLVECTFDASGKTPDEEIARTIKMLSHHFRGRMTVGAGTVLTEKQVLLTKEAGGKFIISPDTNTNLIRFTKEHGLVSVPGAVTPTEIAAAARAGADFVKVFPVDFYGPKYIKTLKAPLSHVRMLAVNGITAENMGEYLEAGAVGVGVGSGIVNKKFLAEGNYAAIKEAAQHYVNQIKKDD